MNRLHSGVLVILLLPSLCFAKEASEDSIISAYLFNFVKYLSWKQPVSNGSVNLCVYQKVNSSIQKLHNKNSPKGRINVIRYSGKQASNLCDLLFVDKSNYSADIVRSSARENIITISDHSSFIRHGGMIGFIKRSGKVKFDISLKNINRDAIYINSKLLDVANHVEQ